MKVQFSNCDVEVWKLRKGVVIGQLSNFVHLESFDVKAGKCLIQAKGHDNCYGIYQSEQLEWLEPH